MTRAARRSLRSANDAKRIDVRCRVVEVPAATAIQVPPAADVRRVDGCSLSGCTIVAVQMDAARHWSTAVEGSL
jgi:hypothetical protein